MVSTHPSLELPLPLVTGLHSSTAHLLSLAFTSSYVGSIYLAKKLLRPPTSARPMSSIPPNGSSTLPNVTSLSEADVQLGTADVTIPPLPTGPELGSRDHPDTIKSRMKAVGVATASSLICVWGVVKAIGGYSALEAVSHLDILLRNLWLYLHLHRGDLALERVLTWYPGQTNVVAPRPWYPGPIAQTLIRLGTALPPHTHSLHRPSIRKLPRRGPAIPARLPLLVGPS